MSDDDTVTKDGAPSVTGYRVAPSVTQIPRETRYRRGDEIARGGLGRVTEAFDQTLQRQVAIKELHQRTDQGRRRFELESLTTARLQHPAIVSVFDSGTWDSGEPFLVLQLLEGTTLAEEIAKRPTLDARLALIPNLLAIADALGYAHEQGVVHRDVKPSNIMLGQHGETVILDWGVAHDSARTTTTDDVLVGTPRFMSPEQARGEAPVPAFDVYSLGVTIATLLTGRQPFAELSGEAIVERLRDGACDVPPLPAEVPPDLASIVTKATASSARYEHAGELATDLRRFIAGKLVSARRYTRRELFARWVRRNRVLLAAATIVIAIGAIAVGSVIRSRDAAIAERERAVARANEMILLEARSHMRTDPTATIAWLHEYPRSAPDQGDLLALVDEAEGRMVAKHVWYAGSSIVTARFVDDTALTVVLRDGAIRLDVATGMRAPSATPPPPTVRPAGSPAVSLVPLLDGSASLRLATSPGELATLRPCAEGEPRAQRVELTTTGRFVTVLRCGVLAVYDTTTRQALWIPEPEHVKYTTLSPDGRWLVVVHVEALDLIELATGATHRIESRAMVTENGFSPDGRSMFAIDVENGIRVWSLPATTSTTGRIKNGATSTVFVDLVGDDTILVRDRLACVLWSKGSVIGTASIALADTRDPDEDRMSWPSSASGDGRSCSFAARDGTTIVATIDGAKHTITTRARRCVLSSDGLEVTCAGDALFTADVATDRVLSSRAVVGEVRDLVRFQGAVLALIADGSSCRLETVAGTTVATFATGDCTAARVVDDAAVVIARTEHPTLVWTDTGVFESAAEYRDVYPHGHRAAIVRAERMELVDLRTGARIEGPPPHERAVVRAAWSSTGVLASCDDETIQLWDAATKRTRVIVAPRTSSLTWSRDGRTLYASDSHVVHAWPIDLAAGASTAEVRSRLEQSTTARIRDGRASTP